MKNLYRYIVLALIGCFLFQTGMAQEQETSVEMPDTVLSLKQSPAGKASLMTIAAPWRYLGYSTWDVHAGLNANLNMGMVLSSSKNSPWSAGSFFTDLSLLYARPLSDRWTVAFGSTLSRYTLWNQGQNVLTFEGMADYMFNPHFSVTAFGSYNVGDYKSLPMRYGWMGMAPLAGYLPEKSTLGLQMNYKVNSSLSFHVSVWRGEY